MGHMRQSPDAPLFAMQSAKSASRGTKCHGVRDARPLQDLRSLRKILWQACEADLEDAISQAHRGVHFNRSGIAPAKAVLLTINCSAFDHQLQCFSTPNSTAIEKRLFWGLKTSAFDHQNRRF